MVHNTLSGAYVVLDTQDFYELRERDAAARSGATQSLQGDEELLDSDVGILVNCLEEEEMDFRAWFETRRGNSTLDVVVGVNLSCNFACTYCSQKDVLDGSVMTLATADATADWLVQRARSSQLDAIQLSFVGGEPLLHPGRIKRIVMRIRAGVGAATKLTFSVTTNGYLVTAPLVDELVALGLEHVKITIDGDASTHSLTRVAKNGEDTFQRTLDSVIIASRRVRVTVNGNYEARTIAGFRPLVADLAEAGLPQGSSVSFTPALTAFGHDDGDGLSCSWAGSDLGQHVALQTAIAAAGFAAAPLGIVGPCEFHDVESFAIGTSGQIYKCPGFLGHPEWAIGSVLDGLTGTYETMLGLTPKSDPCGGCSDRPNCGGGCIAAAWIHSGNTDTVNCEKRYFEAVRPDALARGLATASADARPLTQAPLAPPRS